MKLLNHAHMRRFIIDTLAELRPAWGCNRVSAEALDMYEAELRRLIRRDCHSHPSAGKTFKP